MLINVIRKTAFSFISVCIPLALAASLTACSSGAVSDIETPTPTVVVTEAPEPAREIEVEPEPTVHFDSTDPERLPQFLPMTDGEDIAVITTSMGEIRMRFFPEYAPYAVENFITLANDDYYKDMIFHRVINQFMIQTGDPTGTGAGGQSIWGEGFVIEPSNYLHFIRGAVGMARASGDYYSNRSQFFIVQNNALDKSWIEVMEEYRNLSDEPIPGTDVFMRDFYPEATIEKYIAEGGAPSLDREYTVFGQVYEGMDVVDKIAAVQTTSEAEGSRPLADVQMISIEIHQYKK